MRVCGFIGEQPKDFPWEYGITPKAHDEFIKQLKEAIEEAVELNEITTFCCGLIHSADLDFAECVLYQKEHKYPTIKLICVVDKENLHKHWNKQDAERYKSILERADEQKPFSDISFIETSEQLIAAWNGKKSGPMWDILYYAMQERKLIRFIRLNDIKTDTDTPDGKLKRELKEANEALERSSFVRIGYTFLIKELIKHHPNPRSAFKLFITNKPVFKREILRLAELYELDLSEDFN